MIAALLALLLALAALVVLLAVDTPGGKAVAFGLALVGTGFLLFGMGTVNWQSMIGACAVVLALVLAGYAVGRWSR